MKRWPLVASFVLFIALVVSLAYWVLQLSKPPLRPVAAPPPKARPAPQLDAAASLFGGRATTAVASNFQLKGVVVSGNPADSVAILSADGKPPQAVRANAEIMPGVTVKEVHPRYVLLSDGGVAKRVELPEAARAQAGGNPGLNPPVAAQPAVQPAIVESMPPPEQPGPEAVPDGGAPGPLPPGAMPGRVPGQNGASRLLPHQR